MWGVVGAGRKVRFGIELALSVMLSDVWIYLQSFEGVVVSATSCSR
jgi:hypothetical protein